jgi:hypothetical protein
MSSECSICGGYVKTTYITRRLPAVDAATCEPYPIAPVPPIRFCQGHTDNDFVRGLRELQSRAGITQEELDIVKDGILNMAKIEK